MQAQAPGHTVPAWHVDTLLLASHALAGRACCRHATLQAQVLLLCLSLASVAWPSPILVALAHAIFIARHSGQLGVELSARHSAQLGVELRKISVLCCIQLDGYVTAVTLDQFQHSSLDAAPLINLPGSSAD